MNLRFAENKEWERNEEEGFAVARNLVYCSSPRSCCYEEGKPYQSLIIIAPIEYINEDGTVNETKKRGRYSARTAPVVFKNNCQGWFSSIPETERDDCVVTAFDYVREGFVYVGCGARSRNIPEGKAPAPVVDLKAGVRYLRQNAEVIPGNMERIFSFGGSGAGEMSSVLGAAGNMKDYFPYLYEIGACGIEKNEEGYVSTISDAVYGCAVYYAIGDIGNMDIAYAWARYDTGETSYKKHRMHPRPEPPQQVNFTPFQLELQKDMAIANCEYNNSLELKDGEKVLKFDIDPKTGKADPRSGSYYLKVLESLSDALNLYLAEQDNPDGFIMEKYGVKTEAGTTILPSWLSKNEKGYHVTDYAGYLMGTGLMRNKNIPSFDTMEKDAENNAFGREDEAAVHYSSSIADLLTANMDKYRTLKGWDEKNASMYIGDAARQDVACQVYLMNAVAIFKDRTLGKVESDVAKVWRVRQGTADQHAGITVNLDTALGAKMNGAESVDFSMVWNMPHGREIEGTSAGTFINWVHSNMEK